MDNTISPKERKALEKWVGENESNMSIFKNYVKENYVTISKDFDSDQAYKRFFETIKSKKYTSNHFHSLVRYAALFMVLLTVGYIAKRFVFSDVSQTSIKVVENEKKIYLGNDILIKLADGTTKTLSPDGNDVVSDANGNVVANVDRNSITFDSPPELEKTITLYNEIFIPNGEIFKLKLSDGTLVWLNAGSKLRFPQSFETTDENRTVYLEGEAFFEVTKNKDKPFIVNTQEVDVKVLGTKFNITSYENDDFIATTLVEGSVSVYENRTPDNGVILTPSFQASYNKFGNKFSKEKVDTDNYTAWINNRLVINNLRFSEILVKLERRYSVKFINNAENLNDEFYEGEFVDEDIKSVLKTISISTPFSYEINQNIITITD
ncbi:FecR family protein [Arenibacter palladensis]|uniref:FecR family protein n=1 Tax=Arenibacter palladensis TaxID=237373 RepID=UPI002FD3F2E7